MGKKKKKSNYGKTYIKIGERNICVDELVKAVNNCDKEYGLRLKHPDIWAEPDQYRKVVEAKFDMSIAAMICCLNGIDVKDYFEIDTENGYGTISKPVGLKYKCFTDSSILNWDNPKEKYNTDSLVFRCRFVTLVFAHILGRIDTICDKELTNKYKYKHSRSEKGILVIKDILNHFRRFLLLMVNQESKYQNMILKIHEYVSFTKKNVKHKELKNLLNGHILNVRKGMRDEMFTDRFMSDDLAIYNILKVAYMLATNKTNVDVIPHFKHIEGATVEHNLIKLIEELGAQIITNTKDKKYTPMFKAFIEARPSIWSQFYKESEDNYAIQIGLLSLAYAKFVFNDENIDVFIDEMMKKGK